MLWARAFRVALLAPAEVLDAEMLDDKRSQLRVFRGGQMGGRQEGESAPEGAEAACLAKGPLKWPKIAADYHGAFVRLATMRAAKKQYLIFGYVELFPRDIPLPESFSAADRPWAVPGFRRGITLVVSARAMPVADALAWYGEAARGRVTIPGTRPPIDLTAPPFGVEPALGRFSVGEDVPFAPRWHSGPRIHRLVPMKDPDEAVQKLGSSAFAREWLAINAGFDPFPFEEWLGSISLLAPDPLLVGVGHFTQGRGADGSERIVLQAHRRRYAGYPEAEADVLRLVLLQRRPAGWTEVLPTSFDDEGFAITDYPEPVSESGFAISCPTRGLLRMVPPTLWMGQISVEIGHVNAVLDVEVPAGGRRKPASRYKTNRVVDASRVQVGEALPPSGAIRIVELQEARQDRIRVETAPQRLFGAHESDKEDLTEEELKALRAEAEAYVAGLVAGAQRRVVFVDPDFGLREMQNYALRPMRDRVGIKILTSAPRMRAVPRPGDSGTEPTAELQETAASPIAHGVYLLRQLRHLQSKLGHGAPEVFVMPWSGKPLFHDRFVVIDDIVWASGPSFNELGERIGLISRVHEPRSVIAAIERALLRSQSLADWIDESGLDPPAGGPDAAGV